MDIRIRIVKRLSGFTLDVNLESEREILGVLGASGSGKSMLLRCIAGLIRPDEGYIEIGGRTLFDSRKRVNLPPRERRAGFLFQNYGLFPHMTLEENIGFGLSELKADARKVRVRELLERFHLKELGGRYPTQVSGGQQQRVALARAMAVAPEILLLDEPFSALDNHLRNHMMREMQGYLKEYQGCALCVTHNMDEAYVLCDRIAVLHGGRVEAFDHKNDLFHQPRSLEAARITGCKNIARAVSRMDGLLQVPDWDIRLKAGRMETAEMGFVGIRANHIRHAGENQGENCFPVWVADRSEGPFRATLYLKIGAAPTAHDDFHIQWELSREQLQQLDRLQEPLWVHLPPEHVFFVCEGVVDEATEVI